MLLGTNASRASGQFPAPTPIAPPLGDATLSIPGADIRAASSAPTLPSAHPTFWDRLGAATGGKDSSGAFLRAGASLLGGGTIGDAIGAGSDYVAQQRQWDAKQRQQGFDNNLALGKLAATQHDAAVKAGEYVGRAAAGLRALPPEQRAGALAQYQRAFAAQGQDPSALNGLDLSDGGLEAQIGTGRPIDSTTAAQKPQIITPNTKDSGAYKVEPYGGGFTDITRPPTGAPASAQPANSAGITPGTIMKGHRFLGGNPSDPRSWAPAGGAPSQGGATFR